MVIVCEAKRHCKKSEIEQEAQRLLDPKHINHLRYYFKDGIIPQQKYALILSARWFEDPTDYWKDRHGKYFGRFKRRNTRTLIRENEFKGWEQYHICYAYTKLDA
jgi:hypothetical protein